MYKFGMLTEELIRDRLVIGLTDHSTKLSLLKEENLDLNKALNICRSNEAGSQQSAGLKYWPLVTGSWSLVTSHWSLVTGRWSLVAGHWSLIDKLL